MRAFTHFRASVSNDTTPLSDLVAAYQAKGGTVRTFARGDSGNFDGHLIFLQARGYALRSRNGLIFELRGPGEKKSKSVHRSELVRIIDRLRAAEGKETLRRQA